MKWFSGPLGAFLVLALSALLVFSCAESGSKNRSGIQIAPVDLRMIWELAPHNAFTDLIEYQGDLYLAFREGITHVSQIGRIRVLRSTDDGATWDSVLLLENPISPTEITDLRDAKLSITPGGDLMLTGGTAIYGATEATTIRETFVVFTSDGTTWSPLQLVGDVNKWIWRPTWHDGVAYGIAYNTGALAPATSLYSSTDGITWTVVAADLLTEFKPTEATVRFVDDTAWAIQRRDQGTALLGSADPPYTDWTWTDLGVEIGGQEFFLDASGHWIGGGRMNVESNRTYYFHVDLEKRTASPLLRLPSGKDSAYCGLIHKDGLIWMSYYSDHEDKARIYLARGRVVPR